MPRSLSRFAIRRSRFGSRALVPRPKVIPAFHAAKTANTKRPRQALFPPAGTPNAYVAGRFASGTVWNIKQSSTGLRAVSSFVFGFIAHFEPAYRVRPVLLHGPAGEIEAGPHRPAGPHETLLADDSPVSEMNITIRVIPWPLLSRCGTAMILVPVRESGAPVGSSASTIWGLLTSARAMASRL